MNKRTHRSWTVSLLLHAALAGAFAAPALAQGGSSPQATGSGLVLGARAGFGIPFGKTNGDASDGTLSDGVSGKLPLWLDVGYRINPNFQIGAFFQYSFAFLNEDKAFVGCKGSGVSCSGTDLVIGGALQYHFAPDAADPWVGLGLGWEHLGFSLSDGIDEATLSTSGINFLDLQAGLDIKAAPGFAIGPFVDFTVGEYSSTSLSASADTGLIVTDPQKKALHEWLVFGVRGVFDL